MKKVILIVFLIAGAMFFTKPDKEDFTLFVEGVVIKKIQQTELLDSGSETEKLIGQYAAKMAASLATETDLYLLRMYAFKYGNKTYRYCGVFTTFIPLQFENPLDNK